MNNINLPKKIRRNRTKKFTKKRQPYKSYLQADWTWSDVFLEIDDLKKTDDTFLKTISLKYGINYSTLSKKYNTYCKTKHIDETINTENRGGSNKIFSLLDEKDLYNYIVNEYINRDRQLNNSIIKEIALKMFSNKKDKDGHFEASNGWCSMFKKRWNLSTQTVKPSKIASTQITEDEQEKFLIEYETAIKDVKKRTFLIMMRQVYVY
jgi:hypothetical protein